MKKIILLVALTSLSFIIKAQTCFGVHTGLNYSTFSEIKELTDNSPYLCGLHLGVFMNYRIPPICIRGIFCRMWPTSCGVPIFTPTIAPCSCGCSADWCKS